MVISFLSIGLETLYLATLAVASFDPFKSPDVVIADLLEIIQSDQSSIVSDQLMSFMHQHYHYFPDSIKHVLF